MSKRFREGDQGPEAQNEDLREKLIGLGERSMRKSYFPELQQRMSELERFRTVLDHATDAILVVRCHDLSVADCNLSARELFDMRPNIHYRLRNILPPSEANAVDQGIRAAGPVSMEICLEYAPIINERGSRLCLLPLEANITVVEFDAEQYAIIVARDVTERKQADARLRETLHEKEVMLKEIHHRVKNNLQIISSLLNLQAGQMSDQKTQEYLRESQVRIRSMALVHEKLYQSSDLSRIDFSGYIESITSQLMTTYNVGGGRIRLAMAVQSCSLPIHLAVPCGLIISELVTNSLKYAFPDNRQGRLIIGLSNERGHYTLRVEDDGVGLPEGFSLDTAETLGLILVRTLATQIGADVEFRNEKGKGTCFLFRFEKE